MLLQLLTDLQKITQHLLPASANAPVASPANAANAVPVIPNVAAQISLLDTKLKSFLTAAQPQDKNPPQVNASADVSPATTGLVQSTLPQPITSAPVEAPKKDLSGTWQSQIFATQSNASGSTASPPTAAQVFANSAALMAAANNNSGNAGSGADSDFLPDNQNPAPQIAPTSNAAASAEGVQATGTYNFASTLSALRAVNGGAVGLPTVVDQVILQMNRSVKSGNDQMTLQLNPADLGKITVKLDFSNDGKVQGTVTADNPQTSRYASEGFSKPRARAAGCRAARRSRQSAI